MVSVVFLKQGAAGDTITVTLDEPSRMEVYWDADTWYEYELAAGTWTFNRDGSVEED